MLLKDFKVKVMQLELDIRIYGNNVLKFEQFIPYFFSSSFAICAVGS